METRDVIIVGGGPAGLSAALKLASLGIRNVTVLERETEAGGIPRHCGHLGFGWQSHRRIWTGPRFAGELRSRAAGLDVRTGSTALAVTDEGVVTCRSSEGLFDLRAKRILIATGTRETPRAARLTGGGRPQGVMNTGALQQHVYLFNHKPFMRPVIVGTEWVSFSALLTCRHLGIKPVAMVEENSTISAPRPGDLIARLLFGVPVWTDARVVAIEGLSQVEAVRILIRGSEMRVPCDGVIFTGQFRPENTLFANGPFVLDGLSPQVDEALQTSHPAFVAAGNVLGPLKTSGQCWRQGQMAADTIFKGLS